MADQVFPMGSHKTAHSSMTAEQLLFAVVKKLGGRIMLDAETMADATDGNKRVFDQVLTKDGHHYLVLAIEQRML